MIFGGLAASHALVASASRRATMSALEGAAAAGSAPRGAVGDGVRTRGRPRPARRRWARRRRRARAASAAPRLIRVVVSMGADSSTAVRAP